MASDPTPRAEDTAPEDNGETELYKGDLTEDGRYIPYSGGSAGWFENSGVLKSERRNNYLYHQEMDLPEVRARQFLRWGPEHDRRKGLPRRRRQLPVNLLWEGHATPITTWDINNRGVRLQLTEQPDFGVGAELSVELLHEPGGESILLLDAQVIWMQEAGATRRIWNVGLFFPNITAENAVTLRTLLEG